MNWRRGLFRLWSLASIFWIAASAVVFSVWDSIEFALGIGLPPLPPGFVLDTPEYVIANIKGFTVFGLGIPLLSLALGFALAWVIRGFRPTRAPPHE